MICAIISEKTDKNKNTNDIVMQQALQEIGKLIAEGYDVFYSNCEIGMPLYAAKVICALKSIFPIQLHIIIPYENQAENWSETLRDMYFSIHEQADSVDLAHLKYNDSCYKESNMKIIDKCDIVVLSGKNLVDSQCYAYAHNIGKPIRIINEIQ